ncbi:DUF6364 family protein [Chitinophaga sp.]|uniref:DUF6364 family protein n=1 Tax=Chitinophaga sp. TaxID=1869181 RepID=UPI0031DC6D15
MTTKLTLTIEDEVIHLAKSYANAHNQSLSSIVESYLRALTASAQRGPKKHAPQVARLKGAVQLPEDFNDKKAMAEALAKKYGK